MNAIALVNGTVVTLNRNTPDGQALLIENGLVQCVGSTEQVLERKHPETPVVDLDRRVVLPGLIDAHTHVEFCALSHDWLDVRAVPRTVTLARLRDELRDGYAGTERWLVAQGTFGQDLPVRAELDELSRHTPIIVRESMHRLTANTAALERAGMVRGFTAPVGTLVEISEDGAPSGWVEEGYHLFPVPVPEPDRLRTMLRDELRDSFARHGITCIYELPASAEGIRAYQRLNAAGDLPTRLSLTLTVAPGLSPILSSPEQLADIGLVSGFGDENLWLGGFKVFLDGDDTSAFDSAHLTKSPSNWSTNTRQYAEIVHLLTVAHRAGLQVWIHAIGDLAQHLALDAIEEAGRVAGPGDRRTRLEHAANLWIDDALVRRLHELDVIPVPTAGFIHADPGDGTYAFRTLIESGLRPPGNSDTGGTQPFATNPWFGVAAMLDRTNRHGVVVAADEAVDTHTALRTYTEFAAKAGFREAQIGALGIGMHGDCAVYANDPRELSPAELRALEADLTVVGGRVVWQREDRS
ncbi:putative amidohydrolase YtcJ [Mycobacterium frederiksbergense]|uniref:Amidohydrolase YtcJ n=1 Tax=Mycolicibacterium frederiksbergense TaxID=117567 RepID=A0ABT6KX21_9MYCO|nr:amidohydrolase family protein [Mycolicibacterium frederiksbergense]MDH6195264.1 putative amidohydrolase YtcJ [Mycolicibacterium frederiksbergense]